jgi:hypothetical protein
MSVKDVGKDTLPLEVKKELERIISKRPDQALDISDIPDLPEPEEAPIYRAMYHGPGLDSLTQISKRETPEQDKISDTAVYRGPNYKLTMTSYGKLLETGLRPSAQKLFDALVINLTGKNSRDERRPKTTAIIDLEAYMKRCGKPLTKTNKDYEKRRIKEDLDTLYNLSLEWTEYKGKHAEGTDKQGFKNYAKMRICTYQEIKNNTITATFPEEIVNYLTHAYIMWYSDNLLKTDDRYPSAYHIGRKLQAHYSQENNHRKGTANIMAVKTLLDRSRDIPSEEEVRESGRQYYQRRIDPLIKSLNHLVSIGFLIQWRLCNSKLAPLSESQQAKQDYDTVINCYIHFEPSKSKELQSYLEKQKDREEKQAKAKTKQRRSGKPGKE